RQSTRGLKGARGLNGLSYPNLHVRCEPILWPKFHAGIQSEIKGRVLLIQRMGFLHMDIAVSREPRPAKMDMATPIAHSGKSQLDPGVLKIQCHGFGANRKVERYVGTERFT